MIQTSLQNYDTKFMGRGGDMYGSHREWISDNLRYILLGLAVILLIVIAFSRFA